MAELLNERTLQFFLWFVTPGFVALTVYDLLVPGVRRDFGTASVQLIAYSLLNHVTVFTPLEPLLVPSFRVEHPAIWYLILVAALVIAPSLGAAIIVGLRKSAFLQGRLIHPTPTGWDFMFGRGKTLYLSCQLRSGKRVGGYFGANSFASSYPEPPQVYVEELWKLDTDGHFIERVERTGGGIISLAECDLLEIFADEAPDEREQRLPSTPARRLPAAEEGLPADVRTTHSTTPADRGKRDSPSGTSSSEPSGP